MSDIVFEALKKMKLMSNVVKKCEHGNCKRIAVWKFVFECMTGAADYSYYCDKHMGQHLWIGETYYNGKGWMETQIMEGG